MLEANMQNKLLFKHKYTKLDLQIYCSYIIKTYS